MKNKSGLNWKFSKSWIAGITAIALPTLLLGCGGKTAFEVTSVNKTQVAPGNYSIPPKVDILLVEDDTGSISEIYNHLSSDVLSFLNQLEASNWDYRFSAVPLTTPRAITQVVGSVYDANRGSSWKAPYPGAKATDTGMILPSLFSLPESFAGFITQSDVNNSLNGSEPGLQTILSALQSATQIVTSNNAPTGTLFRQNGALSLVVVVGNGNDTSGVNYCDRGDGVKVPCNDGSLNSSFNFYLSQFKGLVPNLQFYAAVANQQKDNCQGGRSLIGTRYKNMATALSGKSYDICSVSVSQILSDLKGILQETKKGYRQRLIILDQAPNPDTIRVYKNPGGSVAQQVEIPRDENSGWTFENVTNENAIDAPIEMNPVSGPAIVLHGDARLVGDDTASVDFKPAGASNAVSN